jgi:hypothetical protein
VLHIAVRIDIEGGEPRLTSVFSTGKEVQDLLLLLDDTLLLFASVGDALCLED